MGVFRKLPWISLIPAYTVVFLSLGDLFFPRPSCAGRDQSRHFFQDEPREAAAVNAEMFEFLAPIVVVSLL